MISRHKRNKKHDSYNCNGCGHLKNMTTTAFFL